MNRGQLGFSLLNAKISSSIFQKYLCRETSQRKKRKAKRISLK